MKSGNLTEDLNRIRFILESEADRSKAPVLKRRLFEVLIKLDLVELEIEIMRNKSALDHQMFMDVINDQDALNLELADGLRR